MKMNFWFVLLQIVPIVALIAIYIQRKYHFWSNLGLTGPKPVSILGNVYEEMCKGLLAVELEWSRKYGKVYGTYLGWKPVLAIGDPELVKQVLVRDFNVFMNRDKFEVADPLLNKGLFVLEDDKWKRVRAIVSPAFTSGKLKAMNLIMNQCTDKLVNYFEKVCQNENGVIDTKEVIAGFTVDVIASTSFATETDANGDREKKNPFLHHGRGLFEFNPLRLMVDLSMPFSIKKLVNWCFPNEHYAFFGKVTKQVIKHRRETNFVRNDFVQLLMDCQVSESELKSKTVDQFTVSDEKYDVQKNQRISSNVENHLDDIEISAQCIAFFAAGFDTVASTISHCLFELARNCEIQNKLVDELCELLDGLDTHSEQYYDTVMHRMTYLDAVIKETLRMYPPLVRTERRVGVEGYKLAGLTLMKDQLVNISIYAMHHNVEYFPEPERFNPERFMPEQKDHILPYTYLPFSLGPRNCVGMRFAYQELRLCLAKIVRKFKFCPTVGTPDKLEFVKFGIGLLNVAPFPLKIVRRE